VGYRGKVNEQTRARQLRGLGWTYDEIAADLSVSKSSVSLWCRDVELDRAVWDARRAERALPAWTLRGPSVRAQRKQAQIEVFAAEGRERIGRLSDREFLVAGTALYAGEGAKTDGCVKLANTDPRIVEFFMAWLRRFFEIDESQLRVKLYLHDGLDLDGASDFWSTLTGIPLTQFTKPYRAVPDPSIRRSKHPLGCPSVSYSCATAHRAIMGLVQALLTCGVSVPG
jgi:hypothetical protein